jgi:hypothetical protein
VINHRGQTEESSISDPVDPKRVRIENAADSEDFGRRETVRTKKFDDRFDNVGHISGHDFAVLSISEIIFEQL